MEYNINNEKIYTGDDYYKTPESENVELINGKFYNMASPSRIHQEIVTHLIKNIGIYIDKNKGNCSIYTAPFDVRLSQYNIVVPDISIICDRNKLDDRGCNGAPDLVMEIVSPSSKSNDYIKKLNLYLDYGVKEYWIINPLNKTILVYFFESDLSPFYYKFGDDIKVNIYNDLYINFGSLK